MAVDRTPVLKRCRQLGIDPVVMGINKTSHREPKRRECRLDNVVFRLGFARTRKEARQTVRHGHITVNGKRCDIPSRQVKASDVIAVADKYKDLLPIKEALISSEHMAVPAWLEVDIEKLKGTVLQVPTRDQIDLDLDAQLIVELYSK